MCETERKKCEENVCMKDKYLCVVCVCVCVQVQEEFDDVDRMWRSLPTDAELLERQTLSHDEMVKILHPQKCLSFSYTFFSSSQKLHL